MRDGAKRLKGWAAYYDKTGDRPPRETLLFALDRFDAEPCDEKRLAVDLGCGGGRDAIEILRRGWRLLAIDAERTAIKTLIARDDLPPDSEITGQVSRFVDADWPACELINSSFALPLMPPEEFPLVWAHILATLKPGGRFAGHLFGDRDEWVGRDGMTFHDRDHIDALLKDFDVEMLREEEDDSTTVRGEPKHWHLFHIVARKP